MLANRFSLNEYDLVEKARELRIALIRMLAGKRSGHTGGALGMTDVFTVLFFSIMGYDPNDVNNDERDRFLLSCGHICPILYVSMAYAGYFPVEELRTIRDINSRLQGHPHNLTLPGIENSSGPLGEGISQAVGQALRAKMDGKDYRIFCVVSDGENQEGQFWEAMLFAGAHHLDNLYIIVDKNNIQIDGYVQNILPIEPLDKKYESFNFDVFQMNGNNIPDILYVIHQALGSSGNGRPKIISANTVLGAGVPFMENKPEWHGKPPSEEQAEEAIQYLQQQQHAA